MRQLPLAALSFAWSIYKKVLEDGYDVVVLPFAYKSCTCCSANCQEDFYMRFAGEEALEVSRT
jgi:hypothetical protein